jgi:hypothetical protein
MFAAIEMITRAMPFRAWYNERTSTVQFSSLVPPDRSADRWTRQ